MQFVAVFDMIDVVVNKIVQLFVVFPNSERLQDWLQVAADGYSVAEQLRGVVQSSQFSGAWKVYVSVVFICRT